LRERLADSRIDRCPRHCGARLRSCSNDWPPPFGRRVIFANQWLFAPLITRALARAPATDAAIRTTTAATMFEGSPKSNVLASHARAVVNFRILPGDTVDGVLEHVRRTIDDPDVHIRTLGAVTWRPYSTPTSAVDSRGAQMVPLPHQGSSRSYVIFEPGLGPFTTVATSVFPVTSISSVMLRPTTPWFFANCTCIVSVFPLTS
jgi:Peptidase dimerisation domain